MLWGGLVSNVRQRNADGVHCACQRPGYKVEVDRHAMPSAPPIVGVRSTERSTHTELTQLKSVWMELQHVRPEQQSDGG